MISFVVKLIISSNFIVYTYIIIKRNSNNRKLNIDN